MYSAFLSFYYVRSGGATAPNRPVLLARTTYVEQGEAENCILPVKNRGAPLFFYVSYRLCKGHNFGSERPFLEKMRSLKRGDSPLQVGRRGLGVIEVVYAFIFTSEYKVKLVKTFIVPLFCTIDFLLEISN